MNTLSEAMSRNSLDVPESLSGKSRDAFESRLAAMLQDAPDEVVIDCATLDPVTSSHVALLWNAQCQCAAAGARLRLESPSPSLRRVLQVLDLESVFSGDSEAIGSDSLPAHNGPPTGPTTAYQDEIVPTPGDIDNGIARFLEFLSQSHVPDLALFELRIVMFEIATNIMCHSTVSPRDRIGVDARVNTSGITLEISDPGPAFDPTAQPICTDYRQAGINRQTRGFGLAMIRGLVDKLDYTRRNENRNVLIVTKQWSADE